VKDFQLPPSSLTRFAIFAGSLFAALAVLFGAFGAHALADTLESSGYTLVWQTAVDYQFWHALGLVLVGLLLHSAFIGKRSAFVCIVSMALGVLCFSGSLYALALGGPRFLGPVTPLGGLFFLVAWITLISCAVFPKRSTVIAQQ